PLIEIPEIEAEALEEAGKISSNGPERRSSGEHNGEVAAQATQFFSAFLATFEESAAAPSREGPPKRAGRAPARESKRNPSSSFVLGSPPLDLRPALDREKLIVLTGPGGVAPREARTRAHRRPRAAPRPGSWPFRAGRALQPPLRGERPRHPEGRPSPCASDRPEGHVRAPAPTHGEPRDV